MIELFIRRPVISAVICFFILFVGMISCTLLTVRAYPIMPANEVTITTSFYGASPEVMKGFVTEPYESSLVGLDGVDYISSVNQQGISTINIFFKLGTDIDRLLPKIRDDISSVQYKLPSKVQAPVIKKINPNSGTTGVVVWYGFTSDSMMIEQMTGYINNNVLPKLQSSPKIDQVIVYGGLGHQMSIVLDPLKMAYYGVGAKDVDLAIRNSNINSTVGQIHGNQINFNVNLLGNITSAKVFDKVVVKEKDGGYITIGDIGKSYLKQFHPKVITTLQGKRTVIIGVVPIIESSSLRVSKTVKQILNNMKNNFPAGLKYSLLMDQSIFAKQEIHQVGMTMVVSIVFVFIVIFSFLGSIRTLLVPIVTIPLSILGGAIIMLFLGYSINSLTLLAWVLAIGLVVDDAIVVIENIYRHIEKGLSSLDASILGVKEITPAIIAMTLVVAINFIPIGVVPGYSGALFKEFAFTMAIVVIISGLLALYVSPAMCSGLIKKRGPNDLSVKIDNFFDKFKNKYLAVLNVVLRWKYIVLIIFVLVVIAGFFMSMQLQSEMVPLEYNGVIVASVDAPGGRNMNYTLDYGSALEKEFSKVKESQAYGVFYGGGDSSDLPALNKILGFMRMSPLQSEKKVINQLQHKLDKYPGAVTHVFALPALPGNQADQEINFVLKTTGSYDHLYKALQILVKESFKYPSISKQNTDFKLTTPQINLKVNRQVAQSLGVPLGSINNYLSFMLSEPLNISYFSLGGYSYPIVPLTKHIDSNNIKDINNYYILNNKNKEIPLSYLIDISQNLSSPNILSQFQQVNSARFVGSVSEGYSLGEALKDLNYIVKTKLPKDIEVNYAYQSREYMKSRNLLMYAFFVSIVLIYFLLCINYNSFVHPLIVMLSVPLCLFGGIYALYLSGGTFNLYTKIGLIMLVGLISKHGILIVSFANDYLKENKDISLAEAVMHAAGVRIRPILMTTSVMVLGALPLVCFHGAGSNARNQIGWVIIGGMCFGTLLSLFVVPCAYVILNHKKFGIALAFISGLVGFVFSIILFFDIHTLGVILPYWFMCLLAFISLILTTFFLVNQTGKFLWAVTLLLYVLSSLLAFYLNSNLLTLLYHIGIFGLCRDYFSRVRHAKLIKNK